MDKMHNEDSQLYKEKAVLIGVVNTSKPVLENEIERSIEELALLAKTAGAEVVGCAIQRRHGFDNATFIGKGKLQEINAACDELQAETLIFDDELSGSQIRNIEQATGRKVIDRTLLILDIFAQRAQSKEGKLQVELAQQKYRYSRLIGFGESLSRLGAGIGTRGPGESKLETDRRHIKRRIDYLKAAINEIGERRDRIREKRRESDAVIIAVVGYTNAGKSTLINRLCASDLFAKDMLFATLDSAARRLILPDGLEAILIDTVGFIRKLPHNLIEAFKSTLEELVFADIILHVVDSSDEDLARHMEIVEDLLVQLNAASKPRITVFNKTDIVGSHMQSSNIHSIENADNLKNIKIADGSESYDEIINETENDSENNDENKNEIENDSKNNNEIENDSKNIDSKNVDNENVDNENVDDENINDQNIDSDYTGKDDSDYDNAENPVEFYDMDSKQPLVMSERLYAQENPAFNAKDGIVLHVSAVTGDGIESLLEVIKQQVQNARTRITIDLPYKDAGVLDFIRKNGSVEQVEYLDTGIRAVIRIPPSKLAYIEEYIVK